MDLGIDAVTDRRYRSSDTSRPGARPVSRAASLGYSRVPAPPPKMIAKTRFMRLSSVVRVACVPVRWRLEHARQWTVTWRGRRRSPRRTPSRRSPVIGGMIRGTPRELWHDPGACRGPQLSGLALSMTPQRCLPCVPQRWSPRSSIHPTSGAVRTPLASLARPSRRRGEHSLANTSLDRRRQNVYKSCTKEALRTRGAPQTPDTRAAHRCASVRGTQHSTRRDYHAVL